MKKIGTLLIVLMVVSVGFLSGCNEEIKEKSNPMLINNFQVTPLLIESDGIANLTWNVTGAINVSIDNSIGFVSLNGTMIIQPTQNTTYTLTAKNLTDIKIATTEIIVTTNRTIENNNQSEENNNQTILTVQEVYQNKDSYINKRISVVGYYILSNEGPCLIPANTAADVKPAIKIILDEASLNLAIQKTNLSLSSNLKCYVIGVLQKIPLPIGFDVKIIVESIEAV